MMRRAACNFLILRHNQGNIQFYSMFPKTYVPPIYKKDEIEKLYESPEDKQIFHLPIKPATTFNTCSVFHDETTSKFTNYLMRKGNRTLARKLVDQAFKHIKIMQLEKYYKSPDDQKSDIILDPKVILQRAVQNCIPVLELYIVSRGGINYKVPVPIRESRACFLSMNWLIESADDKPPTVRFHRQLAIELVNAAYNTGKTIKKRNDLHKECEANRAYAHYRWMQ